MKMKRINKGHSEFQIRHFIVGSEIHPWPRYKQCMIEIMARSESIEDLEDAILLKRIRIADIKSRRVFRKKSRVRKRIELKKAVRDLKKMVESLRETKRELKHFSDIAREITETSNFDDLTDEQIQFLEEDSWRKKAEFMMALDSYCLGNFSKQTMEFVFKLPRKIKRDLMVGFNYTDRSQIMNRLIEG